MCCKELFLTITKNVCNNDQNCENIHHHILKTVCIKHVSEIPALNQRLKS